MIIWLSVKLFGFIFFKKLCASWACTSVPFHWLGNVCCSVAKSCLTPCDPMDCSTPGFPVLHYLLHFAQTHVHWAMTSSNHLILCHHLLLLPSVFLSIRIFSRVGSSMRWPRYWTFSVSISPPTEYSGLISFTIDWSLQSKGISQVFSNTTIGKHQFFSVKPSVWPKLTLTHDSWKNYSFDHTDLCRQSNISAF